MKSIRFSIICGILCIGGSVLAQNNNVNFKVIGFYTGNKNEMAHVSFVQEANKWFSSLGQHHQFKYDSTNNWDNLNATFLSAYQVVLFLDARPELPSQREAFKNYMDHGGAWMGFHFAGFALTPSDFNQDWDWYHNQFLGSGSYASNTWRPTSALLRVEDQKHPSTIHLRTLFTAAPNEWYRWEKDLRQNPDIKILLSIDPSSFPLGTGPKPHEIWHSGYYPVAWTNKKYRMLYFNIGHNDLDYENKTNHPVSSSFSSEDQNEFLLDALLWLGSGRIKFK
jgi:hypothetical protein